MEHYPGIKEDIMGLEEARAKILLIRDQVYAMGNNDYEIPAINEIVDRFDSGVVVSSEAAAEAVAEAQRIFDSKEGTH